MSNYQDLAGLSRPSAQVACLTRTAVDNALAQAIRYAHEQHVK
ncbi:hypothetical protein [Acidithiobacillus sp.]|nr:hypothetical protein [Acidithiobacillus sp.]